MNRRRNRGRQVFNFLCAVWLVVVPVAALFCFFGRAYNYVAVMCYFAYWNLLILSSGGLKGE